MGTRNTFRISGRNYEPSYMKLYRSGELYRRVERALTALEACKLCPRNCGIDRRRDKIAVCKTGRRAVVASYHPHLGEEDPLRGWCGSGTIFFSWCNLRCVFCQNFEISREGSGVELEKQQIAEIMLQLQDQGCHNINLVTPEHVVPQVLEALPPAIEQGLRLPLVYNTSAYDSIESLQLLDGIVDIYMPDFKIWEEKKALRYLRARDYPERARAALKEMHRQVGVLRMNEYGLAQRGVLVRHLVMPERIAGTEAIMRFLADELSPDTYVNMMRQYYPAGDVNDQSYVEINRRLKDSEYEAAVQAARDAGLWRFDQRHSMSRIW